MNDTYTIKEIAQWMNDTKIGVGYRFVIDRELVDPTHGIAAWKARREAEKDGGDPQWLRYESDTRKSEGWPVSSKRLCAIADRLEALQKERDDNNRQRDYDADRLRCVSDRLVKAEKRLRALDAALEQATIPICIGRPIIEILAKEGQWLSINGNSVVAADCLFGKNPYERFAELEAIIETEGKPQPDEDEAPRTCAKGHGWLDADGSCSACRRNVEQPDADGWIPHLPGEMPCPKGKPVEVKLANGIQRQFFTGGDWVWMVDGEWAITHWRPAK